MLQLVLFWSIVSDFNGALETLKFKLIYMSINGQVVGLFHIVSYKDQ